MKALLHTAPFAFSYTDVPDPDPGPDDIVVSVKACGICGSDVQGYTGKTGRRVPPVIMGHEASGVVDTVGSNVTGLQPGDRVCFDSTIYCNECEPCRQGKVNRCVRRQVLGVSLPGNKREGAMAEKVVLPSRLLVPMPETLSFVQAALLEPVSIGLHAVARAEIEPGETVLVVGAGTIGLFVVQAARLRGAERIIVTDLSRSRLELARRLGATDTIHPDDGSVTEFVRDHTSGNGADICFEVVGFESTLHTALAVARTGGRIVLVGNLTPSVNINVQEVVSRELTLRGAYASAGEYREAVSLVASGAIDVMSLVSETVPLARGQRAFDRLYAGNEDLLKIVLIPG